MGKPGNIYNLVTVYFRLSSYVSTNTTSTASVVVSEHVAEFLDRCLKSSMCQGATMYQGFTISFAQEISRKHYDLLRVYNPTKGSNLRMKDCDFSDYDGSSEEDVDGVGHVKNMEKHKRLWGVP